MKQKIKIVTLVCSMLLLNVFMFSAVLDNLEDGDNGNWWGGFWYTYDDSPNGGNSVVYPLPDAKGGIGFIPSDVTDQLGNNYAARMWGQLGGGYQYAFVGMGTNLAQNGSNPAPADISGFTAVRFKVKGNGKTYQFKLNDPNAPNRNYKVYLYTFTAGPSWQTITVNLNETDLAYGWGNYNNKTNPGAPDWNDKPPLSQVLRGVEAFQWQTVDQTAGTQVDLWIDDIELIGGGTTLPTKPSSTPSDGLIDNLEDGDAANNLSGYWFTFNDSADGGNTTVNPPQGSDYQPTQPGAGGSSYAATFSWQIANPTYINPYAALGTNLTPDGPPSYADGSNTTGIRLKYKSDAHHILKINVNENGIEYPYQVGLPPSTDWKEVIFSWDEFVLPAWFMQERGLAGVDAMNNLKLSTRKNRIMSIHFQSAPVRYKNGGSGTFAVDDIYSVGGAFAGSSGGGGGGGVPTYTLTVNVVGNGTVTKNPDKTVYNAGEQVTLTATPGPGATFVGWSGSVTGTQNPITITMDSNKTVTATFSGGQTQTYTLTVNVSPTGGGTVTKNPDKTVYNSGETVTLTAIPANGYAFVNWTEGTTVLGTNATLSITMTSNRTITANFQQVQAGQYTITILINPAGAGTVTKNPNQPSYTAGTQVTLQAVANPGYQFSNWSGSITGTQNPITVTVNSNMTITANFTSTGGGGAGGTATVYITDNPLVPGQAVQFRNLKSGDEVKIYTILGTEVNTLKESGGVANWDGKDKNGNPLDSGVYIYKTTKSGAKGKIIIQK